MNLANIGVVFAHKDKETVKCFRKQFKGLLNVEVVRCPVLQIPSADCIVSFGNSYGTVTDVTSNSMMILMKETKDKTINIINNVYYGEQPVGTTVIFTTGNQNYPMMAYVPVTRFGNDIEKTINPYLAFRSLLIGVINHNKISDNKIRTLLLAPIGLEMGIGSEESAKQMRIAYGFVDAGLSCSEENAKMIDGLLN
jgi:hypothetical protein